MKQQIKEILINCPKNMRKHHLSKEMIEWLELQFPNKPFSYQCFLVISDDPLPQCMVCGKLPNKGKVTCSRECREKLKSSNGESSIEKMKHTLQERYGIDNAAKLKTVQEKRIQTNIEKYGNKVSENTRKAAKERALEFNKKSRETLVHRYGVSNSGQLPDHRVKCKRTLIKNYKTDNYFKSKEWKEIQENQKIMKFSEILKSHAHIVNIHSPKKDLLKAYENPNDRIEIQCKHCGNTEILTTETIKYRLRTFGEVCSKCLKIDKKASVAENQIADFLSEYVSINRHNRTIIAPYELDIVIENQKLAIEYCGLFWHNDKRIGRSYHKEKLDRCLEQGYQLITVFEDEWLHKSEIVKSRLLHKLGLDGNRIYARNTQCKRIDASTARKFCDQYHIQGYHNAKVNYGLYKDNELLSVMTFRKGDVSKKQNDWELSRFCSIPNTSIVGGASKLFKSFVQEFDLERVVTFSDLRWNTGNVYKSLGFEFVSKSQINYWYIKGTQRRHRFGFRKQANEDQNKTEFELRDQQGWNRIWDCGNAKYVWTNPNTK